MARLRWDKHTSGAGYSIARPLRGVDITPEKVAKMYNNISDAIKKGKLTKVSQLPSGDGTFWFAEICRDREKKLKELIDIVMYPETERFFQSKFYAFRLALHQVSYRNKEFKYSVTALSRITGYPDDFCKEASKVFSNRTEAYNHLNTYKKKAAEKSVDMLEHLKSFEKASE